MPQASICTTHTCTYNPPPPDQREEKQRVMFHVQLNSRPRIGKDLKSTAKIQIQTDPNHNRSQIQTTQISPPRGEPRGDAAFLAFDNARLHDGAALTSLVAATGDHV